MTIPWNDQSPASTEQPRSPESLQKGETTEKVTDKNRESIPENHPQKIFDPPFVEQKIDIFSPLSLSDLFRFKSDYLSHQEKIEEPLHAPVKSKPEILELNLGGLYLDILSCSRFLSLGYKYISRHFSVLEYWSCDPYTLSRSECAWTESRRPVHSCTRREIARLTLRLSLILVLLVAVETENSIQKSSNSQTWSINLTSPPLPPYFVNAHPRTGLLRGLEVWSDPRHTSRTVGKHRCICTKTSFFVSPHDSSESFSDLFLWDSFQMFSES